MKQPAEWSKHDAVWTAWPHLADEWALGLEEPRAAMAAMIAAIVDLEGGAPRGERVDLLVDSAADEADARRRLGPAAAGVRFHRAHYGDVWLRDTAPVFLVGDDGLSAACFEFDGWGGKYVMPGDQTIAPWIAGAAGAPAWPSRFVLEGGAIDADGAGRLLTTRQCLLRGNRRHGNVDLATWEHRLEGALGARDVVWLDRGLANDHTDGHVDTLARFVAPGVVVAMAPEAGDPNRDALDEIIRDLRAARLEVVTVPSPGAVVDRAGALMPASYMNFYIANTVVVVPTYRAAADERAVAALAPLFPGRRVVPVDCWPVLVGGGGFHCTTQQQPSIASASAP